MININLSEQEFNVLMMSINHCLETCKQGGANNGCSECETLEQVAGKLAEAKKTASI